MLILNWDNEGKFSCVIEVGGGKENIKYILIKVNHLYVCAYVFRDVWKVHAYMKLRGCMDGIDSLLSPCGFYWLTLSCQTLQQTLLHNKVFCLHGS